MTRAEIIAFNAGVRAVLDLAKHTADTIDASIKEKPTRYNFAAEALRGLAEEGVSLFVDIEDGHSAPTPLSYSLGQSTKPRE